MKRDSTITAAIICTVGCILAAVIGLVPFLSTITAGARHDASHRPLEILSNAGSNPVQTAPVQSRDTNESSKSSLQTSSEDPNKVFVEKMLAGIRKEGEKEEERRRIRINETRPPATGIQSTDPPSKFTTRIFDVDGRELTTWPSPPFEDDFFDLGLLYVDSGGWSPAIVAHKNRDTWWDVPPGYGAEIKGTLEIALNNDRSSPILFSEYQNARDGSLGQKVDGAQSWQFRLTSGKGFWIRVGLRPVGY